MSVPERPLRLFVAAEVPLGQRELIQQGLEPHKNVFAGARFTALESQHITLKFLGTTPQEARPRLDGILGGVAAEHRASAVALSGLGVFPSATRARVLWAGVGDPESLLTRLASSLDLALGALGYGAEKRAFTPHLTLARFKTPARLREPLPRLDERRFTPFEVDRIILYSSRLHPHGARYEALASYPLNRRGRRGLDAGSSASLSDDHRSKEA